MAAGQQVVVMDRLPPGVMFRGATGPGVSCAWTPPDVTCEHAALPSGEVFSVRMEVQLLTRGGTLTSQATVDPQNWIAEANESNNRDQATILIR